jgi:hypothetical protein
LIVEIVFFVCEFGFCFWGCWIVLSDMCFSWQKTEVRHCFWHCAEQEARHSATWLLVITMLISMLLQVWCCCGNTPVSSFLVCFVLGSCLLACLQELSPYLFCVWIMFACLQEFSVCVLCVCALYWYLILLDATCMLDRKSISSAFWCLLIVDHASIMTSNTLWSPTTSCRPRPRIYHFLEALGFDFFKIRSVKFRKHHHHTHHSIVI